MTRGAITTLSLAAYAVLTAAVLICVGLTGSALLEANDRLGAIDTALTSVKGHADPLTYQVTKVNDSLTAIEQSLSPLHSQADTLNGTLSQVQQTLSHRRRHGEERQRHRRHRRGQPGPGRPGPRRHRHSAGPRATPTSAPSASQATEALGILGPVENDLSTISGLLIGTNGHLSSACHKTAERSAHQLDGRRAPDGHRIPDLNDPQTLRARPLVLAYWVMPLAAGLAVTATAAGMLTETLVLANRIDANVTPISQSVGNIKLHTDTIAVLTTVDKSAAGIKSAADPLSGQATKILSSRRRHPVDRWARSTATPGASTRWPRTIDGTVRPDRPATSLGIAIPAELIEARVPTTIGLANSIIGVLAERQGRHRGAARRPAAPGDQRPRPLHRLQARFRRGLLMRPMERKLVHGFAIFEGIAFLGALILFLVIIGNTLVADRRQPGEHPQLGERGRTPAPAPSPG